MRFKNRYLLLDLVLENQNIDESLSASDVIKVLRESIQSNFGDYGTGCTSSALSGFIYSFLILIFILVKYFNYMTGICIVRCSRDHYKMVLDCLNLIKSIKTNRKCIISCIYIGGTIRSCQEAAISHSQNVLIKMTIKSDGSSSIQCDEASYIAINSQIDRFREEITALTA